VPVLLDVSLIDVKDGPNTCSRAAPEQLHGTVTLNSLEHLHALPASL